MVDENGMLVKISKNTNAFVANEHISDLGEKQGKTKHKIGSKVTGRILKMDPVKRRTTMTLQKSLLTCKTTALTSLEVQLFSLFASSNLLSVSYWKLIMYMNLTRRQILIALDQ